MNMHKKARLTVHSRALMVRRALDEGRVPKSVATDFGVSERTVYKWIGRYRQEGVAGLSDRPSAARRLAQQEGPLHEQIAPAPNPVHRYPGSLGPSGRRPRRRIGPGCFHEDARERPWQHLRGRMGV